MLPQKYIALGSYHSPVLDILNENGYKEIDIYSYMGPEEIFLVGRPTSKDCYVGINPYIQKFPIYTPRQVFMEIETLDRLIEYSPEELTNLEIMLKSEDLSVIYLAAKLIARMRPEIIMRFVNLCPKMFYIFSNKDEDPYIRVIQKLATEIIWSYQSEFI